MNGKCDCFIFTKQRKYIIQVKWIYFYMCVKRFFLFTAMQKLFKNRACFSRVMITNVLPPFSVHSVYSYQYIQVPILTEVFRYTLSPKRPYCQRSPSAICCVVRLTFTTNCIRPVINRTQHGRCEPRYCDSLVAELSVGSCRSKATLQNYCKAVGLQISIHAAISECSCVNFCKAPRLEPPCPLFKFQGSPCF